MAATIDVNFVDFPSGIRVVLGDAWNSAHASGLGLVSGTVVNLTKVSQNEYPTSGVIVYSEDGTLSANETTNRIKWIARIDTILNYTTTWFITDYTRVALYGADSTNFIQIGAATQSTFDASTGTSPTLTANYTFKNFWTNSPDMSVVSTLMWTNTAWGGEGADYTGYKPNVFLSMQNADAVPVQSGGVQLYLQVRETPAVSNSHYVTLHNNMSGLAVSGWNTKDLSAHGVPPSSVVEVLISNTDNVDEYEAGIRMVGSSLNRKFSIHKVESQTAEVVLDCLTMHCQTNSNSEMEYYIGNSGITLQILGYWTSGCFYTELADTFTPWNTTNEWRQNPVGNNHSFSTLKTGTIAELVASNTRETQEYDIGIRSVGSVLERRFLIHEAEGGGEDFARFWVKVNNGTSAGGSFTNGHPTIEWYGGSASWLRCHVVGYWSIQPQSYRELWTELTIPSGEMAWEGRPINRDTVPELVGLSGTLDMGLINHDTFNNTKIGMRTSGDTTERIWHMHPPRDGGYDMLNISLDIGENKTVELLKENDGFDHEFKIMGVWGQLPIVEESITLYMRTSSDETYKLYWFATGPKKIYRSNEDGNNVEEISNPGEAWIQAVFNFDYDTEIIGDGQVYWLELDANDCVLKKANIDLTGETILDSASATFLCRGLAVDRVNRKIYWSDFDQNKIFRIDMDGSNLLTITSSNRSDYAVVDTKNSFLYFADSVGDYIKRCNLDGSNMTTVLDGLDGIDTPTSIDIDMNNNKIYWINRGTEEVQRSNTNGTQKEAIISGLTSPRILQLDTYWEKIFINNTGNIPNDQVFRADLDGSNLEMILTGFIVDPIVGFGIEVINPTVSASGDMFLKAPEPFIGSGNLFLKTPEPFSGSGDLFLKTIEFIQQSGFLFMDASWKLHESNMNLFLKSPEPHASSLMMSMPLYDAPIEEPGWLFVNDLRWFMKLKRIDIQGYISESQSASGITASGVSDIPIVSGTHGWPWGIEGNGTVSEMGRLDVDIGKGKIFFIHDDSTGIGNGYEFGSCNIDGTYYQGIMPSLENFDVAGLAVDIRSEHVYFTENFSGTIWRIDYDGSNLTEIVADGFGAVLPTEIRLDRINQHIYWIDFQKIMRCNYNGTNVTTILTGIPSAADSIALNLDDEYIYFNHPVIGKIKRVKLDGSQEVTLVSNLEEPKSLEYDPVNKKLYWLDGQDFDCKRANALNGTQIEVVVSGFSLDAPSIPDGMQLNYMRLVKPLEPPISSGVSLYLANSGSTQSWPMIIRGTGNSVDDNINILIHGSPSGENSFFYRSPGLNLFLEANNSFWPPLALEDWKLYLKVESGPLDTDNAWSLFLGADFKEQDSLSLHTYGHLGDDVHGPAISESIGLYIKNEADWPGQVGLIPIHGDWSLFIKVPQGVSGAVSLHMSGVPLEGTPISVSSTLLMSGVFGGDGYLDLYIAGVSGIESGAVTLHIFNGGDMHVANIDLYIHGY